MKSSSGLQYKWAIIRLVLAGLGCLSQAEAASFRGLGDLEGGRFHSVAYAVSPDGSIVVGGSNSASGYEAFYWIAQAGMVGLGDLAGGSFNSEARAISSDGLFIVGSGYVSFPGEEPVLWYNFSDPGIVVPASFGGQAVDVSADGQTIVYTLWSPSGTGAGRRIIVFGRPKFESVGDLPGGYVDTRASGVSDDGNIIVGRSYSSNGPEAFRWTQSTGIVGLGDLPGGIFDSEACDISANGAVIVGYGTTSSGKEAFRWTASGGIKSIGLGEARAVSYDGSIVVGTKFQPSRATIWDADHGIRKLQDVLEHNCDLDLTGWTLQSAEGISADGSIVVGYGTDPNGYTEAWIAHITPPDRPIVLTPNGREVLIAEQTYKITWEKPLNIAEVLIEYSTDAGAAWTAVDPPNVGNTGTYYWPVPPVRSDQCLVRISSATEPNIGDTSDAAFTIKPQLRLVCFNRPEVLFAGKMYEMRWETWGNISEVVIKYSTDKGSSWVAVDPPNIGNTGRYSWLVPDVNSNLCSVRISDASDSLIWDQSDWTFTIIRAQTVNRLVPNQYATIQAAIDDCNNGDTVIVADGIYTGFGNRDIDFHGKIITVRSENGPQKCIIDCNGTALEPHRGFYFHTNEGPSAVLDGFTIINGYATERGGGIFCKGCMPTIKNCIFSQNKSEQGAGGICNYESQVDIANCIFSKNVGRCGAVEDVSGRVTLNSCIFIGNRGESYGGGVSNWGNTEVTLNNCIFSGNSAKYGGGGLNTSRSDTTVINCTFSANSANEGGGVCCDECTVTLSNCILWANTASTGPELAIMGNDGASVSYSDIKGGQSVISVEAGCFLNWVVGNINSDPCFINIGHWEGPTWIEGNYHLRWDSVCINTGDPASPGGKYTLDVDGEPRIMGRIIDIGADEVGPKQADFNRDGIINLRDAGILAQAWLAIEGAEHWYPLCDLWKDGQVNLSDIDMLVHDWLWQADWHVEP